MLSRHSYEAVLADLALQRDTCLQQAADAELAMSVIRKYLTPSDDSPATDDDDADWTNYSKMVLEALNSNAQYVFTAQQIQSHIQGATNLDSIAATLYRLAKRGRIRKVGIAMFQALEQTQSEADHV